MKKMILFLLLVFLISAIWPQSVFAGGKKISNSAKKAEKKRKRTIKRNYRKTYQAYKSDKIWAPEPKFK